MKIIATTLFALLTATFGCATDDVPDGAAKKLDGIRDVVTDSRPDIEDSFEIGSADVGPKVDNGRVMWVEVIDIENSRTIRLHHLDADTGIDTIETLDEDGVVQRVIETRYSATELDADVPR